MFHPCTKQTLLSPQPDDIVIHITFCLYDSLLYYRSFSAASLSPSIHSFLSPSKYCTVLSHYLSLPAVSLSVSGYSAFSANRQPHLLSALIFVALLCCTFSPFSLIYLPPLASPPVPLPSLPLQIMWQGWNKGHDSLLQECQGWQGCAYSKTLLSHT